MLLDWALLYVDIMTNLQSHVDPSYCTAFYIIHTLVPENKLSFSKAKGLSTDWRKECSWQPWLLLPLLVNVLPENSLFYERTLGWVDGRKCRDSIFMIRIVILLVWLCLVLMRKDRIDPSYQVLCTGLMQHRLIMWHNSLNPSCNNL